jgi:hypothetical protein
LRREEKEKEGHWCFFAEREERRRRKGASIIK